MTKGPNRKKTFRKNKKQNKNKSKRRVTKRNTRKMRGGVGKFIKTKNNNSEGELIIPDTFSDDDGNVLNDDDSKIRQIIKNEVKIILGIEKNLETMSNTGIFTVDNVERSSELFDYDANISKLDTYLKELKNRTEYLNRTYNPKKITITNYNYWKYANYKDLLVKEFALRNVDKPYDTKTLITRIEELINKLNAKKKEATAQATAPAQAPAPAPTPAPALTPTAPEPVRATAPVTATAPAPAPKPAPKPVTETAQEKATAQTQIPQPAKSTFLGNLFPNATRLNELALEKAKIMEKTNLTEYDRKRLKEIMKEAEEINAQIK